MFWGSKLGNDLPRTIVDELNPPNDNGSDAMTFNNGAPHTHLLENQSQFGWAHGGGSDFGVLMGMDELSTVEGKQAIAMHELGHALSIGWNDDDPIGFGNLTLPVASHGLEAYSGDTQGTNIGVDETPEFLPTYGSEWSIMILGTPPDYSASSNQAYRFAFSIEELLTVDFKYVPSQEEDGQS